MCTLYSNNNRVTKTSQNKSISPFQTGERILSILLDSSGDKNLILMTYCTVILLGFVELHPLQTYGITKCLVKRNNSFYFTMDVMIAATNVTHCWESTQKTCVVQDTTADFPVCLAGTVGADDLHYTVHAQHGGLQSFHRRMWEQSGGGLERFPVLLVRRGKAGGHIPGRFRCHREDGGQSEHTPQSRNYTEFAAPSIDMENKGFWLSCNLKSVCRLHIKIRSRSTRTIASSPFCDPVYTQSIVAM